MKLKAVKYKDIEKYPAYFKLSQKVKEDFFGSSPAPFVGKYGYPDVNVGLLAPQSVEKDAWLHDAPRHWATQSFGIDKIVDLRMSLVNSRAVANIKKPAKITQMAQEVGLAKRPVDIEVKLTKIPKIMPLSDHVVMPMGPTGQIKKARITENVKVDRHVQKAFDDTDLKAGGAVVGLYKKGIDENALSRILSVGALGIGKNRKLVPTRWSITATDDTLGKNLITKIKDYPESDCMAYFGGHLGNYFLVLVFSDIWSYELFEMYMPNTGMNFSTDVKYSTDHEFYEGRKTYADNTAGGYYASRLPILDSLVNRKRQGQVLVLRFITDEYRVPLGVWVVREAVRKAMEAKPWQFGSKELMLQYVEQFIQQRFNFDVDIILSKSKLLHETRVQRRLREFIS